MIPLQRTLTYRLHLLHKLSDVASHHAYLLEAKLSMSDGRCLAAVGSFAPLSVNDLAATANLTKGQASRAAQSLVDQKLVVKTNSTSDGRGVVLTLTAKGRVQWHKVMTLIDRRNDEIFGDLSAAEQQQLSDIFDRLLARARSRG
jgi:DNA-binding MarR family transcriptional regulator